MKTCTKCGIEKDESEFGKCSAVKSGKRGQCNVCHNENNRVWRENNREYNLNRIKKWHLENKEHGREYEKSRVKERKEIIKKYRQTEKGFETNIKCSAFSQLKKQIGATPPPELVEIKSLIIKTKRLCKTLKS